MKITRMHNLLQEVLWAVRNKFFKEEIWSRHFLWELLLIRFQGDSHNAETTQEVLSDFYLRTLEEWDKIPQTSKGAMIAYLKTMLKNVLADHWRGKMNKVLTQELKLNFDAKDEHLDAVDDELTLKSIDDYVTTFGRLDQQIFDLKYRQLKRGREIAAILGIPHNTVDIRVMRMKGRLRKFLAKKRIHD